MRDAAVDDRQVEDRHMNKAIGGDFLTRLADSDRWAVAVAAGQHGRVSDAR